MKALGILGGLGLVAGIAFTLYGAYKLFSRSDKPQKKKTEKRSSSTKPDPPSSDGESSPKSLEETPLADVDETFVSESAAVWNEFSREHSFEFYRSVDRRTSKLTGSGYAWEDLFVPLKQSQGCEVTRLPMVKHGADFVVRKPNGETVLYQLKNLSSGWDLPGAIYDRNGLKYRNMVIAIPVDQVRDAKWACREFSAFHGFEMPEIEGIPIPRIYAWKNLFRGRDSIKLDCLIFVGKGLCIGLISLAIQYLARGFQSSNDQIRIHLLAWGCYAFLLYVSNLIQYLQEAQRLRPDPNETYY